jgi:predicted kinase
MTATPSGVGPGSLIFMCDKMAAGKTTLARRLAQEHHGSLLAQDELLERLYPGEFVDFAAFVKRSAQLRAALAPHIVALLALGLPVILDFPGNTRSARRWFRELFELAGAHHELHLINASDELCRRQLKARSLAQGLAPGAKWTTSQDVAEVTSYFDPPSEAEQFNVIVHQRPG